MQRSVNLIFVGLFVCLLLSGCGVESYEIINSAPDGPADEAIATAAHHSGYTAYLSENEKLRVVGPEGYVEAETMALPPMPNDVTTVREDIEQIGFYVMESTSSLQQSGEVWELSYDPDTRTFSEAHVFDVTSDPTVSQYDGIAAQYLTATTEAIYVHASVEDTGVDPPEWSDYTVRYDLDTEVTEAIYNYTPSDSSDYIFGEEHDNGKMQRGMSSSSYHDGDLVYLFRQGEYVDGDNYCGTSTVQDYFVYGQQIQGTTIDVQDPVVFGEFGDHVARPAVEYGEEHFNHEWIFAVAGYSCGDTVEYEKKIYDEDTSGQYFLFESSFYSTTLPETDLALSYLFDGEEVNQDPDYVGEERAHLVYTGPYGVYGNRKFGDHEAPYSLGRLTMFDAW